MSNNSESDIMATWRPVPLRLMRDDRFLELRSTDAALLLRLYLCCDSFGRGSANERTLRAATVMLRDYMHHGACDCETCELMEAMGRLAWRGLIAIYPDSANGGSAWQLERYDEDLTSEMRRKRAAGSVYPGPPVGAQEAPRGLPYVAPNDAGWAKRGEGRDSQELGPSRGPGNDAWKAERSGDVGSEVGQGSEGGKGQDLGHGGAGGLPAGQSKGAAGAPLDGELELELELDRPSGEARAPVHTHVGATVVPPPAWPSPEHEAAGRVWLDTLYKHARNGFPSGSPTLEAIQAVAIRCATDFVAACTTTVNLGAEWQGWRVKWPIAWLGTQCTIEARERMKRQPAKPTVAPVTRTQIDEPEIEVRLDLGGIEPEQIPKLTFHEKRHRAYAVELRTGRRWMIADDYELLMRLDWSDQAMGCEAPPWFIEASSRSTP